MDTKYIGEESNAKYNTIHVTPEVTVQSQNCDRHISAWKQAQEIRMTERFKLGQDETTGGNVKSSLDFSAWNELTSNFLFTE